MGITAMRRHRQRQQAAAAKEFNPAALITDEVRIQLLVEENRALRAGLAKLTAEVEELIAANEAAKAETKPEPERQPDISRDLGREFSRSGKRRRG
jgi:hypothetical protein